MFDVDCIAVVENVRMLETVAVEILTILRLYMGEKW